MEYFFIQEFILEKPREEFVTTHDENNTEKGNHTPPPPRKLGIDQYINRSRVIWHHQQLLDLNKLSDRYKNKKESTSKGNEKRESSFNLFICKQSPLLMCTTILRSFAGRLPRHYPLSSTGRVARSHPDALQPILTVDNAPGYGRWSAGTFSTLFDQSFDDKQLLQLQLLQLQPNRQLSFAGFW